MAKCIGKRRAFLSGELALVPALSPTSVRHQAGLIPSSGLGVSAVLKISGLGKIISETIQLQCLEREIQPRHNDTGF